MIQNVNFGDIEGVWTFIYYSYSVNAGRAVAFVKYGDAKVERVQIEAKNPVTDYLRLVVGGDDNKRYPPFNGQIYKIFYSN